MGFKLLITENQSVLGDAICRALEDHSFTVLSLCADQIDRQNESAVDQYLSHHQPVIALSTAIPGADEVPDQGALPGALGRHHIPCIHLSSYRVFGTAACDAVGHDEDDIPSPDDEYGRRLKELEDAFLALDQSVVLRLPWLLSAEGDNIFTRVARRLLGGESLQVSDFCRGCPVTHDDVQRVVVAMVLQVVCGAQNWGAIHMRTSDSCSEAEFADYVARLLEKEGRHPAGIEVLRDQQYHLSPGCALLTGSRCMNNFGVQLRSWRHGIKDLVLALP